MLLRKGDYYRYLGEFKAGDDRKDAADQSLKAYEVCFSTLHFPSSVFFYYAVSVAHMQS